MGDNISSNHLVPMVVEQTGRGERAWFGHGRDGHL
jgi:hypothetical protein